MRKKIYDIIEVGDEKNPLSQIYSLFMLVVIVLSIFPMMFKSNSSVWEISDKFCLTVFIVDYLLRWITADYSLKDKKYAFLIYPFTMMAIIDLVSILPSLSHVNKALKAFRLMRLVRLMKVFKVFRVFRVFRYSKSISIIVAVMKKSREALITVGVFAIGYVYISALVIFNVEPKTFDTFYDALYWATVSLTTVGYGDIYPTTDIGRFITMLSSVFGIAVVALPAGIITAGYMREVEKQSDSGDEKKTEE